jgi:hypothetical protein
MLLFSFAREATGRIARPANHEARHPMPAGGMNASILIHPGGARSRPTSRINVSNFVLPGQTKQSILTDK